MMAVWSSANRRSIARRITVPLPVIGSSSATRRNGEQSDARAHQLTQDAVGNTDHADIVHCRIRVEQMCRLAVVALVSTSQVRRATATDAPHVSVLTANAELAVRDNASGDDERRLSARLRALPDTTPPAMMPLRSVANRVGWNVASRINRWYFVGAPWGTMTPSASMSRGAVTCAMRVRELGDRVPSSIAASHDEDLAATWNLNPLALAATGCSRGAQQHSDGPPQQAATGPSWVSTTEPRCVKVIRIGR